MKAFERPAPPLTYLISDGTLTDETFSERSAATLETLKLAIGAGISLFQIREKQLSAKNLFALAKRAARLAQNSSAQIMVNDRADIAFASGADGVQLTETSLPTDVIRKSFPELIIGVSTHSVESVVEAGRAGADFALFGPVFETPGKAKLQGMEKLQLACSVVQDFPVIAIGGIDQTNFRQVLDAGARGFAAIRFLNHKETLQNMAQLIAEASA